MMKKRLFKKEDYKRKKERRDNLDDEKEQLRKYEKK